MSPTLTNAAPQHLQPLGISQAQQVHLNLSPAALVEAALQAGEGVLTDTGALMADTGKFTGRSPKDRFVVRDENTADSVWWGKINISFEADKFDQLHQRMVAYLADKQLYVREGYASADILAGAPRVAAKQLA